MTDPDVLPQDTLRKYITFAKQRRRPRLSAPEDYDKITNVCHRPPTFPLTFLPTWPTLFQLHDEHRAFSSRL